MSSLKIIIACLFCTGICSKGFSQSKTNRFNVIVLAENKGSIHRPYVDVAIPWLNKLAADSSFSVDVIENTEKIDDQFLSKYQLIIQLDFPPYMWSDKSKAAFEKYINEGRGGWIGFHHATLLGEFDGYAMWQWFSKFMGGIRYENYISTFVKANVIVEDSTHPCLKGITNPFTIEKEEFYIYDKSPRKNVHVLAHVDEDSYSPDSKIKMGDHPVIWTNEKVKARNIYIFMGHDPGLFKNEKYIQLFRNAIFWAAQKAPVTEPRAQLKDAIIHINQVAFDDAAPKQAVVETADPFPLPAKFRITDIAGSKTYFEGVLSNDMPAEEWFAGRHFYRADFSSFQQSGTFLLRVKSKESELASGPFEVGNQILAKQSIPAVFEFFKHQRANSPEELNADKHLLLYGSDKRVDVHGGWCDASGDVSKYFSHLAYTNFMSPQQTPMVVWSMANSIETAGSLIKDIKGNPAFTEEALYGADYLMRSLSPDDYFYMTIFSYFKKDPEERRIVGLLADSKTTSDYQCAYREGGGMAIAALARVSQWKQNGEFTSEQYISAAKRAFKHLEINNLKYDDDGKENIIDDYCALMAATELWIATNDDVYKAAARKRAQHLSDRMSKTGYFISNDTDRPFWHAADAGLPVIALARYLDKENDKKIRTVALNTIRQFLDYQLRVTGAVSNPFGYARQSFKFRGSIKDEFFIPHENESGWWWQGENARLASLATAAIVGGRLVYPGEGAFGVKPELAGFAVNQINWILGGNPYDICFMYQHGQNNTPYMASLFGHGSGAGGIGNGITGKDGSPDGSGIDFKMEADGNEWRWTEQWIPHSAWFLQAVSAMAAGKK